MVHLLTIALIASFAIGFGSSNEINFAKYEQLAYRLFQKTANSYTSTANTCAATLQTTKGASTSLEVADLPNFINIFSSAYKSEVSQLGRFRYGLKNIFVARHGQQVYLTHIQSGLRSQMINVITGIRYQAKVAMSEFASLLKGIQQILPTITINNFGDAFIQPLIGHSIGQILGLMQATNQNMSAGYQQLANIGATWLKDKRDQGSTAVSVPLTEINLMFQTISKMYSAFGKLNTKLAKDYDTEMQANGDIDLPVLFVHLNSIMTQATSGFSVVAGDLTTALAVLQSHHPEPILFKTISDTTNELFGLPSTFTVEKSSLTFKSLEGSNF